MKNFFTHKFRKKTPLQIFGILTFGALAITGLAILFGCIIMWLWNWLMPELFGLPLICYWQAVGLFILLKLLLGGCSGHGGNSKHCKKTNKNSKKHSKTDFSKWKHYDSFWEEEGQECFKHYVKRKTNDSHDNETITNSN